MRSAILASLLLFLTGCPTPPKPAPQITPLSARTSRSAPAAEFPKSAATTPAPAPKSTATWVYWDAWLSQQRGLRSTQQTLSNEVVFVTRSGNDVLRLTTGRRFGSYNGIAVALGFGPRLAGGRPAVHPVDLASTLQPLLRPSPVILRGNIIVIDPGHGGEKTGARSALGPFYEKDFTLDWARRLRPLLQQNGWTVFLTRTNDSDVSLADRVSRAESVRAALFISLHFNSGSGSTSDERSGLETYCLTPAGVPSTLTREYADDLAKTYPNNAFDQENLALALLLHRSLLKVPGMRDQGVRRARFMTVLQGQNRPAVLLEAGFLSNRREAANIAQPSYRQHLAEAIARALPPATGLSGNAGYP